MLLIIVGQSPQLLAERLYATEQLWITDVQLNTKLLGVTSIKDTLFGGGGKPTFLNIVKI